MRFPCRQLDDDVRVQKVWPSNACKLLDGGIARMRANGYEESTARALCLQRHARDLFDTRFVSIGSKESFRQKVQAMKRVRSTEHWLGKRCCAVVQGAGDGVGGGVELSGVGGGGGRTAFCLPGAAGLLVRLR